MMRPLRTLSAGLFAAVLAGGLALGGCGPTVDCEKLGLKLNKCTSDLILKLRPDNAERLKKATDPDVKAANEKLLKADVARTQAALKKEVTGRCQEHKGRAKDAKQINTCLSKSSCGAFADCFAVFLKEKK